MSSRVVVSELMERLRWPAARLAAYQRDQLDGLVRHAVANSPYYRRVLGSGAASGGIPLHELPTLTKTTLMEHFDEIVTDDRLRRGAAEARLASAQRPDSQRPDSQSTGDYRVFATSGSTGRRGIFVYSRAEFTRWVAAHTRMLLVMGVTPDTRVAAIGAPSPLHLSRQMFAELTSGRAVSAPELSVTTPLPETVAVLNAYRPDAISTYASTAALLAEEQLAGRLRIAPAMVATGAETLTDDMRQRIRDAWDREPHQAYLATEAPLLASTCAETGTETGTETRAKQAGLHLWEDLTVAEVVDEHGQPVPPGVPGHKVLITSLVNHTQPLIRYELSDSVTLADGPSPAGFPFRRLTAVEGRSDDIITMPADSGGTVAVHPLRLRAPFATFREVVQYQITHDGELTARVVLRPDAPRDTTERVRTALVRALREAGARPPLITVTAVPAIDREGGHAAKFKLIRVRPRA